MSLTKLEVRNCMAHVLGIVSTSELENDTERCKNVQELIKEFNVNAREESRQVFISLMHYTFGYNMFMLFKLRYIDCILSH